MFRGTQVDDFWKSVFDWTIDARSFRFSIHMTLEYTPDSRARSRNFRVDVAGSTAIRRASPYFVFSPTMRLYASSMRAIGVTLPSSAAVLVAVGALAGWMPAHRASRIDPAEGLRDSQLRAGRAVRPAHRHQS
jgi:hypothetical protein